MSANSNFVISKVRELGEIKLRNISYLEVENVSEEPVFVNEHLRIAPNEKRMLIAPDGFTTDFEIDITKKSPFTSERVELIILYKKVRTAEEIQQETQGACKTH